MTSIIDRIDVLKQKRERMNNELAKVCERLEEVRRQSLDRTMDKGRPVIDLQSIAKLNAKRDILAETIRIADGQIADLQALEDSPEKKQADAEISKIYEKARKQIITAVEEMYALSEKMHEAMQMLNQVDQIASPFGMNSMDYQDVYNAKRAVTYMPGWDLAPMLDSCIWQYPELLKGVKKSTERAAKAKS